MKRTLRQAAIALVVTLLVLEGALQLAGLFAGPMLTRSIDLPGGDAITILCVGDSHTYGAPLPEEEAYPAQLQVLLEKRYPARDFRVINLGFPGVNSAFLVRRLENQILQIRPDLVMISGGLNNRWNELHADDVPQTTWHAVRRALLHVKLFRLYSVATAKERFRPSQSGAGRWDHPDRDVFWPEMEAHWRTRGGGTVPSEYDDLRLRTERDMERMVAITRALDVPVIWYNYPVQTKDGRVVSAIIDETGERLGIPVVRTILDLERAYRDGYQAADLFVNAAGPHPTGILYGYIAESMVPVVADTLKEWRGIDLDSPPDAG